MNQVPQYYQNQMTGNYPQMQYPQAQQAQQPQVNAVKIDIINPQVLNGNQAPNGYQQPPMQPIYDYPNNPIYNVPQSPYYAPMQQQVPQNYAPMQQQAPQNYPPYYAPMQQPQYSQQPVMQQLATPTEVPVPPPAFVNQAPVAVQQPVAQEAPAVLQAPVAPAVIPQAPPAAPQSQIVDSGMDVKGINTALVSADLDAQTTAIQNLAEIAQSKPQEATAFLNEDTFNALTSIITKDNSKLEGPNAQQLELRKKIESGVQATPQEMATALSPRDKAEMNKQYGIYTLAVLQKNFRAVLDIEAAKQGKQPPTIQELPGIVDIVNKLKDDQNPTIRQASVSALTYIARPEDKEVLKTIFEISAKQDADPNVKKAAQDALNALITPAPAK